MEKKQTVIGILKRYTKKRGPGRPKQQTTTHETARTDLWLSINLKQKNDISSIILVRCQKATSLIMILACLNNTITCKLYTIL